MHRFGPGCDFFSIYAAGVKARLGESVYTIGGHVEQVPYAYAFRYAPIVAYTLGLALSWLPHLTAYGVWLCLCELALLQNIRLTWELARVDRTDPEAGSRARARRFFAHPYSLAAWWLLFSPYYLELYVGQFTFITASLVFWAYVAWTCQPAAQPDVPPTSSQRSPLSRVSAWFAGHSGDLFWGTAVLLKLMPVLFLPVALARGRWKGSLATAALLVGSSWLYFQWFPRDWAVFTDTNGDPRPTWHAGNQGLMALLYTLSGERTAPYLTYRLLAVGIVGALLLWLTYRARRASRPHPQHSTPNNALLYLYAAASAGYLLCYKDVWEHHYVLLLPPLVLLALRRESPWLWLPPFLVSALPTLFFLYDVPAIGYNEDPQHYWVPAVSLLHHAWKPIAPLWLTVGIGVQAFRDSGAGVTLSRGSRRTLSGRARTALAVLTFSLLTPVLCVSVVNAVQAQRQVTPTVVWPETVFRKQERKETCGPAALAAVCRHYGLPAEEAELARLAGTTSRGTSMLGLQRAARARGLSAEARKLPPADVAALPRPAILFFHQGHFAVLVGLRGQLVYLADPSLGQRLLSVKQLARRWRGEALVVGPGTGAAP